MEVDDLSRKHIPFVVIVTLSDIYDVKTHSSMISLEKCIDVTAIYLKKILFREACSTPFSYVTWQVNSYIVDTVVFFRSPLQSPLAIISPAAFYNAELLIRSVGLTSSDKTMSIKTFQWTFLFCICTSYRHIPQSMNLDYPGVKRLPAPVHLNKKIAFVMCSAEWVKFCSQCIVNHP